MTDEELMQRFADGDDPAFELLFLRYKDRLYRYLKRLCRHSGIAEELCQEVWERLIRHRDRFDAQRSFATFLFSIAHNRVVDFFRAASSRPFDELDEESHAHHGACTDDRTFNREQIRRFMHILESLPPAQREVFVLHEETVMTMAEIADSVGVNPETAKSRLRLALIKLRQGMEGYL